MGATPPTIIDNELNEVMQAILTYASWGLVAVMLVVAWPQLMLFLIFAGYAMSGLVEKTTGMIFKAVGKRGGVGTDRPVSDTKE